MNLLHQVLAFLGASVLAVPIFKRLGLGSLLGYLAAGVAIGPSGVQLIGDVDAVLHFAEFGIVFLLFLIGLELQPARLWQLRRTVFGVGAIQVVLSALVLGGIAFALGLPVIEAAVVGAGLSLSSTAFALQLLGEKHELASDHGRTAFGILLFQDLAVIPMLAVLPWLGVVPNNETSSPLWHSALKVAGLLVGVVIFGRFVAHPLFRLVASTRNSEIFTATVLLVVLGTAFAASAAGASMALGAFLAGVILADSHYRHELEADIEPFKGLLLGLFFIAVGMSVNLRLVIERPILVCALVIGLVLVKGIIVFALAKVAGKRTETALSLAASISQGGEFAFVLFGLAVSHRVMEKDTDDLLVVAVSISMAITPVVFSLHERLIRPRLSRHAAREFDVAPSDDVPVIIAGFGRVGQITARVLQAKRIPFTAMDVNSEHIDFVRRYGNKVFFGDASRLDLLRAARAEKARVFVLAIDDIEASVRTAEAVLKHFPDLKIIARARNRPHAYRLRILGIKWVVRETFASSIEMTDALLAELDIPLGDRRLALQRFREHDEAMVESASKFQGDERKLVEIAERGRAELEWLFERDEER